MASTSNEKLRILSGEKGRKRSQASKSSKVNSKSKKILRRNGTGSLRLKLAQQRKSASGKGIAPDAEQQLRASVGGSTVELDISKMPAAVDVSAPGGNMSSLSFDMSSVSGLQNLNNANASALGISGMDASVSGLDSLIGGQGKSSRRGSLRKKIAAQRESLASQADSLMSIDEGAPATGQGHPGLHGSISLSAEFDPSNSKSKSSASAMQKEGDFDLPDSVSDFDNDELEEVDVSADGMEQPAASAPEPWSELSADAEDVDGSFVCHTKNVRNNPEGIFRDSP